MGRNPNAAGRVIDLTRGKALGGTSAVNGMMYVRGTKQDYDKWATLGGAEGWEFDSVLSSMKAIESVDQPAGQRYDPAERGTDGPFVIHRPPEQLPLAAQHLRERPEATLEQRHLRRRHPHPRLLHRIAARRLVRAM